MLKNALLCNVKGEENILDPGSVPLSESEAQVNEAQSWHSLILHPSLVEICSVVFV